jgi:acyl carrier protein
LDAVELILELEDQFDIRLSEEDALSARTVGDVYRLVLSKQPEKLLAPVCLSQMAFYRIRRALAPHVGGDARTIQPGTRFDEIVSSVRRRAIWKQLETALGYELPPLEKSGPLATWSFCAALLSLAMAMLVPGIAAWAPGLAMLMTLAAIVALGVFLVGQLALLHFGASVVPTELPCVGDLAKCVSWRYLDDAQAVRDDAGAREVWDRLVALFCKHLAVEKDQVTPEAEIVRDLGAS